MTPLDVRNVEGIVEEVRIRLRRRGGTAALLLAVGAALLVLPLGWMTGGAEGWRPGSPVPLLLLLAGGMAALGVTAWAWRRLRIRLREDALATDLERSSGLPSGSLRAQLELARNLPPGVSRGLARAGEASLLKRLQGSGPLHPGQAERETGRLLRLGLLLTGVASGVTLLLLVASPERSRAAWGGMASPVAVLLPEALPPLEVRPGDARVPRGEPVTVEIGAEGRATLTLSWEAPGEVRRSASLPVTEGRATGRIPEVQGETRYWVSAPDGARSPDFLLEPLDPLLLAGLALELRYPPHTGLPAELRRGEPRNLEVPAGTTVGISGSFVGEGEAVLLRGEDGRRIAALPVEGEEFRGEWRPNRSERVEWEVVGEAPAGLRLPDPIQVQVTPDAPPEVHLDTESGTRRVSADRRVALRLEARDDWGLDWVELEVEVETPGGERGDPATERSDGGNRRALILRPVLDLSEWGLAPGSRLRLRARAADRAPAPGVAVSPDVILEFPDAAELREEARTQVGQSAQSLEGIRERAESTERELRERALQARGGESRTGGGERGEEGFQEREEIRQLLEEQARLGAEVEELREELARAREGLGAEGGDSELARRLRELETLLEEMRGDELRGDGEGTGDLDEAAARQEAFREQLEAALERFEQAALETAFEGTEEAARELAERQEAMAEALREGGEPEAQGELREEAEALEERIRELEERLRNAGEETAAERASRAAEGLEGAASDMQAAEEQARQGESGEAGERAQEAAEEARAAAEALEQARMEWMEEWEERIREALRRAAQDAMALARLQGDIREELQFAGAVRRSELVSREAVLLEGLRNLGTAVGLATRQAASVGRELSGALGEAMEAVERTASALRSGAPRAGPYASAGQAHAAMNRVALAALEGMEQVGQRGEGSATQDLMEALEELAAQQEQLNQDSGELSQDPGQEGAAAQMQELAAAQEAMAGSLGDLAEQPGQEEIPGDLEGMSQEAREIAAELQDGRLEAETLRRQEELLERLLTAGRTLQRDGPTEEREGTSAGPVDRPPVGALPQGLLQGSEVPLPTAEALERLSPAERRLVLDYFDRLNRGGGR